MKPTVKSGKEIREELRLEMAFRSVLYHLGRYGRILRKVDASIKEAKCQQKSS